MRHSYVDMHCDTLLRGLYENETSIYDGAGMQSLKQMINAKQLAQFYAIFFPPKMNPEDMPEGYPPLPSDEEIFERLRNQLYSQVEIHSDQVGIAHNYQEIMNNKKKGMSSAILTIEDGRMIDEDMKKLYYVYKKGVRAIALTWNHEDCVGLGTDFDGVEGNLEIDHPDKMELLFDELVKRGISERVIDKVASDNVLRIIKEAMK